MARALFLSLPLHGHTNPSLPLVRELVGRGDAITYYSTDAFGAKVEQAGARYRPYQNAFLADLRQLPDRLEELPWLLMQATADVLAQELQAFRAERPDYLIADSVAPWGQWVGELLGVPVVTYVVRIYRRDSEELTGGLATILLVLRLSALLGVLFYFLDLERRSERRLVKNSRAIVLVDTSQSMGIVDAESRLSGGNRLDGIVRELGGGKLLDDLRRVHDVVIYRFDQNPRPTEIASFPKIPVVSSDEPQLIEPAAQRTEARVVAVVATVLLAFALFCGLASWLRRGPGKQGDANSWTFLLAIVLLIAGAVVFAVAALRSPGFDLLVTLGVRPLERDAAAADSVADLPVIPVVEWAKELTPRGVESRIGDAIDFIVSRERGGSIAGIVLLTDGGQNAGRTPAIGFAAARDAGIPIHTIGLGSDKRATNVRVVDVEVPERVYPGDRFTLTGLVQSFGYVGRSARIELFSRDGPAEGNWPATNDEEHRIRLPVDGEVLPVKFDLSPQAAGTRSYKIRVSMAEKDLDEKDNERTATVQIVDRKTKVLLFAGGPSRDFQFLRNMLYRDRDTSVDVLLQTGQPGISQEANDILFEFPSTADELFQYDCLIAFDPDWEALSANQARLLERWIGEEAGGFIVLAGPVHTPHWSSKRAGDPVIDIVKVLYPVVFYYQGAATLSLGRFGGDKPWPLNFTPDGTNAEFLWLADDTASSEAAWRSFDGVFGFYAVKDPKPGARVYARFSDPDTEIDMQLPIYMAGQFFGAGRVFFQASGEMWRVRSVDDSYFDTFYTKLIRWTSQGRLLRDSTRGLLLLDKDRCLIGDHVAVRAILRDSQRRPLVLPQVSAVIVAPDGQRTPFELLPIKDTTREGLYGGQFTAQLEGDYYIELIPPGAANDDLLRNEVRVRVPALEIEKAERNDALLAEIAQQSNGSYYIGLPAALDASTMSVVERLNPQDQVTSLPGTPDKNFERTLMGWLMGIICGLLCLEWLVRRLSKLA